MILLDTSLCIHILHVRPPVRLERCRDDTIGAIGSLDMLIGTQSLSQEATLVTDHTAACDRVPRDSVPRDRVPNKLQRDHWVQPT